MKRLLSTVVRAEVPASSYLNKSVLPFLKTTSETFFPTRLHQNYTLRELFRRTRYSVSDLKTQYCELRSFYELVLSEPQVPTAAMEAGTDLHKNLELDVNFEKMAIPPEAIQSREDMWASKFVQVRDSMAQLGEIGQVREIYVMGMLNDRLVTGYIDLVEVDANGELKITDTKTRMSNSLPMEQQQTSAYHQLLLYHELLRQMVSTQGPYTLLKRIASDHLGLNLQKPLHPELSQLIGHDTLEEAIIGCVSASNGLPERVSDELQVEYIGVRKHRHYTVAKVEYRYDETVFNELVAYSLAFWEGGRPPNGVGVSELNKCKSCPMAAKCSWRRDVEAYVEKSNQS